MKNRLSFLSLTLFFLMASSHAQVSNVEGLTPLDGVVIPKPQLTQQQVVKPGAVFKDCDECPEMVVIPAGSFMMGSPPDPEPDPFSNAKPIKIGKDYEKPQHRVNIRSYALGKFEVTQEQWFAVMGSNPSANKGRTLPVENVSWDDVQVFVQKLSQKTGKKYRLPSEAEWEYATRGGSTSTFPWGNSDSQLHAYAFLDPKSNTTNPVGLKKANQFGLYDMIGNVYEWTQDCWNPNYSGAPTDGSAWTSGDCSRRVLRGGSWNFFERDLRTAYRDGVTNRLRLNYFGFRVAMSIEKTNDRVIQLEEESKRFEEEAKFQEEQIKRLLEEKKEAEDRRQEQIKRLKGLGETRTGPTDKVSAAKFFAPSGTYLGRLRARVRPNISFADSQLANIKGNPEAEVEVICSPTGEIISKMLTHSGGNAAWDEAVMNAIEKTGTLPRDENGNMPPKISFSFRPRD